MRIVARADGNKGIEVVALDLGPDNIRVNAISAGPIKTLSAAGIVGPLAPSARILTFLWMRAALSPVI